MHLHHILLTASLSLQVGTDSREQHPFLDVVKPRLGSGRRPHHFDALVIYGSPRPYKRPVFYKVRVKAFSCTGNVLSTKMTMNTPPRRRFYSRSQSSLPYLCAIKSKTNYLHPSLVFATKKAPKDPSQTHQTKQNQVAIRCASVTLTLGQFSPKQDTTAVKTSINNSCASSLLACEHGKTAVASHLFCSKQSNKKFSQTPMSAQCIPHGYATINDFFQTETQTFSLSRAKHQKSFRSVLPPQSRRRA